MPKVKKTELELAADSAWERKLQYEAFVNAHRDVIREHDAREQAMHLSFEALKKEARTKSVLGASILAVDDDRMTVKVTGTKTWDPAKVEELLPEAYPLLRLLHVSVDGKLANDLLEKGKLDPEKAKQTWVQTREPAVEIRFKDR